LQVPWPKTWTDIPTAGIQGASADLLILAMILLAQKVREWQPRLKACIIQMDVHSAFDYLRHDQLIATLSTWGLHPKLVSAIVSEITGMTVNVSLQAVSHQFFPTRGIAQGSPLSMYLFQAYLAHACSQIHAEWKQDRRGININGYNWSLALYADNIWIIAPDLHDASSMAQELIDVLTMYGLFIKPSSIEVLSSQANPIEFNILRVPAEDKIHDVDIPHREAMRVLGIDLAFNDVNEEIIESRIRAADIFFWANQSFLMNKNIPIKSRVNYYVIHIRSVLLYAIAVFTPNVHALSRLRQWERQCIKRMLGIRKSDKVSWMQYNTHVSAVTDNILKYFNIVPIAFEATRSIFLLARRVVNGDKNVEAVSLVNKLLNWRSTWVWETMKYINSIVTVNESWRHRRSFGWRPATWEDAITRYCGMEWTLGTLSSKREASYAFAQSIMHDVPQGVVSMSEPVSDEVGAPNWRSVIQNQSPPPFIPRPTFKRGPLEVLIVGDSKNMIDFLNGLSVYKEVGIGNIIQSVQKRLLKHWVARKIIPMRTQHNWAIHVHRHHNTVADALSKHKRNMRHILKPDTMGDYGCLAFLDAAYDAKTGTGRSGWVIYTFNETLDQWYPIRTGSQEILETHSSTSAECHALNDLMIDLESYFEQILQRVPQETLVVQ
jgi:hypothetical protein